MHAKKRTLIWALSGAVILPSTFYGVRYSEAKPYLERESRLDVALAKSRELGVPLTTEALKARWPVAPNENAGPPLLDAIATLQAVPKNVRLSPAEFQAMANAGDPKLASRLNSIGVALDKAVSASKLPKLDFERDWNQGYKLSYSELGDSKQLIRYLAVRAQEKATKGDLVSGLADFRACYRIASLLGQDPTTLALTTQITAFAIVDVAVQKVIPAFAKDRNQLVALRDTVKRERQVGDWSRALFGEAYIGIASIRGVKDWTELAYLYSPDIGPSNPFMQIPAWMAANTVRDAFMAEYLQSFNQAIEAGGSPMELQAVLDKVESLSRNLENGKHPTTAIRSILLPSFPVSDDSFRRCRAVARCMDVLFDVYVYRAEKGSFPDNLKQAAIGDADPYQKGPLIYKKLKDRIVIYSTGRNGVDDGGIGRAGEGGGAKDVVVWAAI